MAHHQAMTNGNNRDIRVQRLSGTVAPLTAAPLSESVSLPSTTHSSIADYTLLIKRLEKIIIEKGADEKCRQIIRNKTILKELSENQLVEWAGLAQIAGLTDSALEIFEFAIKNFPGFKPAWKEYIELLEILDKKQQLASAVKLAEKNLPSENAKNWLQYNGISRKPMNVSLETDAMDVESDPISDPFIEMHKRQGFVENFMMLFSGRTDVFARQWADRKAGKSGYVPVRRPIETSDIEDHFKGIKTYGFYLMLKNALVNCGVIDADLTLKFREILQKKKNSKIINQLKKEQVYMISRIQEISSMMNLNCIVEISGYKGFHFWYFMDNPVHASLIRQALKEIVRGITPDLTCFDLEVFPKQDCLKGKGFGNLVKFPLGIHRLSGKRSFFPACRKKDIESQLGFLAGIKKNSSDSFVNIPEKAGVKNLVLHPRMKVLKEKYPELFELERLCPPIGRIITSLRGKITLLAREEKILFQTIGFLPNAKKLLHYLISFDSDYNPHLVDYKLNRVRGTPLGCRRIHSLTDYTGGFCDFKPDSTGYLHPLIHLSCWDKTAENKFAKSRKIENLNDAMENMKAAITQVEKFLN